MFVLFLCWFLGEQQLGAVTSCGLVITVSFPGKQQRRCADRQNVAFYIT